VGAEDRAGLIRPEGERAEAASYLEEPNKRGLASIFHLLKCLLVQRFRRDGQYCTPDFVSDYGVFEIL